MEKNYEILDDFSFFYKKSNWYRIRKMLQDLNADLFGDTRDQMKHIGQVKPLQ